MYSLEKFTSLLRPVLGYFIIQSQVNKQISNFDIAEACSAVE